MNAMEGESGDASNNISTSGGNNSNRIPTDIPLDDLSLLKPGTDIKQWTAECLVSSGLRWPTLRADETSIMAALRIIDSICWQLRQLELKKSVDFEMAVRKLGHTLNPINESVRILLRESRLERPGIAQVERQLSQVEIGVNGLDELLMKSGLHRLSAIQERRTALDHTIRYAQMERRWREAISIMSIAMESHDLDAAQAALESLDGMVANEMNGIVERTLQRDQLRKQLVGLIRSM